MPRDMPHLVRKNVLVACNSCNVDKRLSRSYKREFFVRYTVNIPTGCVTDAKSKRVFFGPNFLREIVILRERGLSYPTHRSMCDAQSRRLPRVLEPHAKFKNVLPIALECEFFNAGRQVSSDLRLSDPLGLVGGSVGSSDGRSRGLQSKSDIDHTGKGYPYASPRRYQEPPSPLRHIPLSGKIALATLMLAGGSYYLGYAFRYISAVSERDALLYAFLGLGGIFCGVMLGLQATLGI